jgi:predicted GNAT family N-acyltransferase
MQPFTISEPITADELEKYYQLRYEILRKPWGQPESTTKDEWEKNSIHVLMTDDTETAIAVGRLQLNNREEGQIRSMAVRTEFQGQGLGTRIIEFIEEKAKENKIKIIVLDARENAVKFYEHHGYSVIGDSYLLFGVIKHFRMSKILL